ncbi:MAG: hypothetical protein G01um101472_407 [Parcubacteria group bacterium Gr01-1014_72]|nr:MAG: hypothetical protein G01um101472_407 [Parcubacteria group bacterium Gr01-1014_72]
MDKSWKIKSNNSAILCKTFIERNGKKVLFEVALTDISTRPDIDLDELAQSVIKNSPEKKSQEKIKKYCFTGSHFEPE